MWNIQLFEWCVMRCRCYIPETTIKISELTSHHFIGIYLEICIFLFFFVLLIFSFNWRIQWEMPKNRMNETHRVQKKKNCLYMIFENPIRTTTTRVHLWLLKWNYTHQEDQRIVIHNFQRVSFYSSSVDAIVIPITLYSVKWRSSEDNSRPIFQVHMPNFSWRWRFNSFFLFSILFLFHISRGTVT